jgi:3-phosphoshikimate 1-carboxyvinyltransferase
MINLVNRGEFNFSEIDLPSSKSISNRLLVMRYIAGSDAQISNLSSAHDTRLLEDILNQLSKGETRFFVHNAGTVMRFLTAILASQPGEFYIDCDDRMKLRPIFPLVDVLRKMGADIIYVENEGFPPLFIKGKILEYNGLIEVDSSISSQFLSAILLISPRFKDGLSVQIPFDLVSKPYLMMTLNLLKYSGIQYIIEDNIIKLSYSSCFFSPPIVEADWSSASFFYEMVALKTGSQLFLKGLSDQSLQGDSILPSLFLPLGVKSVFQNNGVMLSNIDIVNSNITADFTDYPDLALPFISACAGLQLMGSFAGLSTLKFKESDRMVCLSSELAKLGIDLRDNGFDDWILLNSCRTEQNNSLIADVFINSHNDHRIVMSLAPLVIKSQSMTIDNPLVVEKSFPEFWIEFDKILKAVESVFDTN